MGLSNAISGGIMLLSLVYTIAIVPNILGDSGSVTSAVIDRTEIDNSVVKTSLQIHNITKVSDDKVEVVVNNTGFTKFVKYNEFSVIVTYDADNVGGILPEELCLGIEQICETHERVRVSEELVYNGTGLAAESNMAKRTFVVYSFDDDDQDIDPNIVNPDEDFKLRLRLSASLWDQTNNDETLVYCNVVTANGVVGSKGVYFS